MRRSDRLYFLIEESLDDAGELREEDVGGRLAERARGVLPSEVARELEHDLLRPSARTIRVEIDEGLTPRDSAEFEALIQSVRDAERRLGGRTVYVAAVDLSHVGPRFGDPAPDERTRAEVEAFDREALEAARLGDADAWFQAIAAHDDATRICGFAPTYAMLRCAEPGPGRQLRYLKSDEKDGSFVSVASMAW